MNIKKRLLSLFTALAISASTLAGMVIPASAEEAVIDFTNRTLTATETGNSTIFEVKDAAAAGATGLAAAGAGDVLQIGSSASGASKNLGYTAPLATTDDNKIMVYSGNVSLSFKLEPMQIRTDKTANMILQFADISKTPILTIDVGTGTNNSMTINGKNIPTAFGNYYIVEANFDCDNKKATITVKDSTGKELNKQENVEIKAEGLSYLYYADADWRYGSCVIDDIQLDATYIGAPVYYTATFNTERYAKLTTSDNKIYYADVNGTLEIPLLKPNTTFDYTISKVGYGEVTGTVEPMTADISEDKPLTKTDDSVLFIESEFGNATEAYVSPGGSRYDSVSIGEYTLPETFQLTAKLNYVSAADGQKTWALVTDKGRIAGLQITGGGMKAWTKWSGSKDMNQDFDPDKFGESVNLGPAPATNKEFEVTFVFNTTEKTVTVLYGDINGTMSYDIDATKLTGMDCGLYRNNGELRTNEIKITTPDPTFIVVSGDNKFAKISGKTVTRQYKKVETVIDPDETFTWTAERSNKVTKTGAQFTIEAPAEDMTAKAIAAEYEEDVLKRVIRISDVPIKAGQTSVTVEESSDNAVVMLWNSFDEMKPLAQVGTIEEYEAIIEDAPNMDGISINSETGELSVTDAAAPGVVAVTCTGSSGKTASVDVDIKDFSAVKATADGPAALEVGKTNTYKITSLKDDYGVNVIDMFAPKFESDNTDVIEIDAATGVATAKAAGNAKIIVTIGNPNKESTVEIPTTVATYSVTTDATGDSTEVSVANINADDAITGYQVTTATAEGVQVNQTTVAKADVTDNKITADTTGAAKVEVAPVYETAMNKKLSVPADSYNITVTASDGARTDVYVNDQMVFNNINQGGDNWTIGRTIAKATDYTANDVVIGEGYANFNYRDDKSGSTTITNVKFVKSPSIVTRKTRLYVIGDSLTAKYYGTPAVGQEGLVRTGWGEVIGDYMTDDVEVTNLGNSGAWAEGMLHDAFTNVKLSGKPGDILVLESGYNDSSHTTMEVMRNSVKAMVKGAEENGMTVFVVTPNASTHSVNEYLGSVKSTYDMIVAYNELIEEGSNAILIDLAYDSGQFFRSYYGDANYEDENGNILKTDKFTMPQFAQLNPVYNNESDTLHSTYNAANCWAAIVANGILSNDSTKDFVDRTHTYTFNDGKNDITVSALMIANIDYDAYDVTYNADDVTVTRPNGATFTKAGEDEMIKVVPKDDTKTIVVTDADETVLLDVKTTISNSKTTEYYFKMPAKAVTITVEAAAATE